MEKLHSALSPDDLEALASWAAAEGQDLEELAAKMLRGAVAQRASLEQKYVEEDVEWGLTGTD